MKKAFKDFSEPAQEAAVIPPPPYPQTQPPIYNNIQPPLQPAQPHGEATSSAYPPQPHHTQSPPRVLHVWFDKWHVNPIRVLDSDNATALYTVRLKATKPHLRVRAASSTTGITTIGTVSFHNLSSRIDATVHDASMTLNSRGILKSGHTYSSPALGGACLTWKRQHHSLDLVCLDEREAPVARFCFSNWSWSKGGRLELLGPDVASGAAMEEMVVTGMAMMENFMVMR